MSGQKIVALLEKNKDVFVHGGAVSRHKQSFVEGRKSIPVDGTAELVVCAAATFKLWQPKPKPVPASSTAVPSASSSTPSADSAAVAAKPVIPRPILVWRQPHGFIQGVVPLANKSRAFSFGFAVFFFAPQKEGQQKPAQDLTEFCRAIRRNSNFITVENSCDLITPPLRIREYRCASEYEQDDWVLAYRTVLCNYWHERLESSLIPAPEVFQYQTFAVDLARQPLVDSVAPHSTTKAPVVQVALSTEKLYLIPRHDQAHLERESIQRVLSAPVGSILSIAVNAKRGCRTEISFSGGSVWKLACFTAAEGSQLVVEIRRIWEWAKKEEPFPMAVDS